MQFVGEISSNTWFLGCLLRKSDKKLLKKNVQIGCRWSTNKYNKREFQFIDGYWINVNATLQSANKVLDTRILDIAVGGGERNIYASYAKIVFFLFSPHLKFCLFWHLQTCTSCCSAWLMKKIALLQFRFPRFFYFLSHWPTKICSFAYYFRLTDQNSYILDRWRKPLHKIQNFYKHSIDLMMKPYYLFIYFTRIACVLGGLWTFNWN